MVSWGAKGLLGAVLVASVLALAAADEFKSDNVVHLTSKNFEELVGALLLS